MSDFRLNGLFTLVILLGLPASSWGVGSDRADVVFTGQAAETVHLVSVRHSVKTTADARLDFSAVPEDIIPNEIFKVVLDGERLSISMVSSGSLLVTQTTPEVVRERTEEGVKVIARYGFSFHALSPLNRVLGTGFTDVQIKNRTLSFVADPDLFDLGMAIRLQVGKRRIFIQDRVVYDQPLLKVSFSQDPAPNGKILYSAPLDALGVPDFTRGSFNFNLTGTALFLGEAVVNREILLLGGEMSTTTRVKAQSTR